MDIKEVLEKVFVEAYKIGKDDAENGLYIKPEILFENFLPLLDLEKVNPLPTFDNLEN